MQQWHKVVPVASNVDLISDNPFLNLLGNFRVFPYIAVNQTYTDLMSDGYEK